MTYITDWNEFQTGVEELYLNSPKETRYLVSWKHSQASLVLKVTDNFRVLKYKTDQAVDLKKFEKLNKSLMCKMQNRKIPDDQVVEPTASTTPSATNTAASTTSTNVATIKSESSQVVASERPAGFQSYPTRPAPGQPFSQAPPYVPPPPPPPPTSTVWTEHSSPDGRKYYFNSITKQSSWDKPDELKTPEERSIGSCAWKEFTADNGSKYYYNSNTKESKWEIPAEYKEFLDKLEKDKKKLSFSESPSQANGNALLSPSQQDFERARQLSVPIVSPVNVSPGNISIRSGGLAAPIGPNVSVIPIQQQETQKIEFETKEEAEKAFHELLKESGVKPDWTWEQTMRAIIGKPMYRALKTLAERKQAFHDYIDGLRKKEEDEKRAKAIKIRQDFISLLESHPEVNSSTRYRKINELFGKEQAFLAIEDDRQREEIFGEYIYDLQATRWLEAQTIYTSTPEYQRDKKLQDMDMLDFLAVYEEHIRSLERESAEKKKRELENQNRQQRKNRDAYRALMDELRKKSVINANSKWKEIFPLITNDERYQNMLGQPGSNPLELFWDVVEELDKILYQQRKVVTEVLKSKDISVNSGMTFEQFKETLNSDERASLISEINQKSIFEQLQRKSERRQRRKIDAFKSILNKNLDISLTPEITYDQARPHIEKTDEFKAIDTEEQRIEIFNKFMDHDDSEEEEGTLKDDDYEDDKHTSAGDYSDRERDGDRRKRRKQKPKYESRHSESRYQDHNSSSNNSGSRHSELKHGEHISHSSKSPRLHHDHHKPTSTTSTSNIVTSANNTFSIADADVGSTDSSSNLITQSPKIEAVDKNSSPKLEVVGKAISSKPEFRQKHHHGDSSAEEGEYVE
nr:9315_t:CDS:10 [Entrophospora candida]